MKSKELQIIMQEILHRVEEGIHVVDRDGVSIIYNRAMENLEQMNRSDVLKKPFREVFTSIREDESTLLKALRGEQTLSKKQTYYNKDKKEITTINTTLPVRYRGEIIGALEISKNITEIKEMSDKILKLQTEIIHPDKAQRRIKKYTFDNIWGSSESFLSAVQIARKASQNNASVFIYGETGTGKELIAQSIHYESKRRNMPFLAQNCAALPESLLEGILFGTAKGGFTGAIDRKGLFEQASGGTLLLDEINSMPYELQAKLLRALQEGYIRRIGGTSEIPVDVRIIATTNEKPQELIRSGVLRRDLFYRLNIIPINLPPLRERQSDILTLCEMFIRKYNEKYHKEVWMVSDKAKQMLLHHEWPGNVRELENIVMAALSVIDDGHVITEAHLMIEEQEEKKDRFKLDLCGRPLDEFLSDIERQMILEKMRETGGNVTRSAELLGIKRQTLQHKLKKYAEREEGEKRDGQAAVSES